MSRRRPLITFGDNPRSALAHKALRSPAGQPETWPG